VAIAAEMTMLGRVDGVPGFWIFSSTSWQSRRAWGIPATADDKRRIVAKLHQAHEFDASIVSSSIERQMVYCQAPEVARLLEGDGLFWQIAPLAEDFAKEINGPTVIVGSDPGIFSSPVRVAIGLDQARLIYISEEVAMLPPRASDVPIFGILSRTVGAETLRSMVAAAFDNLSRSRHQAKLEQDLRRAKGEIDQLNEIGIALSTQRDRESLLNLILQKSCEITDSDAGSLYLVEENDQGAKQLRFKTTQNHSMRLYLGESLLPLDRASLAGYVASTGDEVHLADVYQIPSSYPFTFNRKFDDESGYRSKSMLVVPMKDPRGGILGVIQLINCTRDAGAAVGRPATEANVVPFPEECRALLRSLASQAAVALENIRLYQSIETLFEGFVRASVSAIEARDPTTSGHSFRVADLTVALAEVVDRAASHRFRDIRFSRAEMKEIRYASLLHDFGKVGVREEVLVKAKKLYPMQLDIVKERFAYARKSLEHEQSERKLAYLLEKGREAFLQRRAGFERELEEQVRELDEFLKFILKCNEPTILREDNFARLGEFAARQFVDSAGCRRPLLSAQELRLLSISRGNLDDQERSQIESHVSYTLNFLRQIPWTREIKNIPAIASAHHEKLNGTGYPNNLSAPEIPIQAKMMTIADIYDALSATDRPYKKAVPAELALDILFDEAKRGLVDAELLSLFQEAEVFRLTSSSTTT
jgi:HD-GYP domain-containing protein (c-di-GMP phosphodiesterase class II)